MKTRKYRNVFGYYDDWGQQTTRNARFFRTAADIVFIWILGFGVFDGPAWAVFLATVLAVSIDQAAHAIRDIGYAALHRRNLTNFGD